MNSAISVLTRYIIFVWELGDVMSLPHNNPKSLPKEEVVNNYLVF
jgi:hypothetical protein